MRYRIANACTNADLFWGIKGGGGSLGVVARLTLGTHDLPEFVGAVFATVGAKSDGAFRRLIAKAVGFCEESLFNPHWGEQITFRPNNVLAVSMVFQGLDEARAEAVWRPFFDWIAASPRDFAMEPPTILALPARHFWDPAFLARIPGVVLADALFAASRHWGISLHFNKGLAGAPAEAIDEARDMATNPAVLDAFALAIGGAEGPPAYPGIAGHEPDVSTARRQASAVDAAMNEVRKLLDAAGSYVAESDFFDEAWRESFWGPNYPRLLAVKDEYDADGLFFVHHGVGSERWSADGFTRLT